MRKLCLIGVLALAGCVVGSRGHGPQWVGQAASTLVQSEGMPDRQAQAPSGATVYSYGRRNLHGDELCAEDYFIVNGGVVGFNEHGAAVNCSGRAGQTS